MKEENFLFNFKAVKNFLNIIGVPSVLSIIFDLNFSFGLYWGLFAMYWFTTALVVERIPSGANASEASSDRNYFAVKEVYLFNSKSGHTVFLKVTRYVLIAFGGICFAFELLVNVRSLM